MDLNGMSRQARSAAMRGGMEGWGMAGPVSDVRYAEPVNPRSRRRCNCGCKARATHIGKANGVALTTGHTKSTIGTSRP